MKDFIMENGLLTLGILVILLISIVLQIMIAYVILRLTTESNVLEEENTKWIREWMEDYKKNEKEITNIPVFVERHIYDFCFNKLTMIQMKHLSGQLLLLAIFLAGIGVCKEIINGKTLGQILPYYVICLLGLYIHFFLSGLIDMEEKIKSIQRNVVDFLENKRAFLYQNEKQESLRDGIEEVKNFFGEKEDQELKEILKEILV